MKGNGKFGVGALDGNAVPDLQQLIAFAEIFQANAGGLVRGGSCLEVVLDDDGIGLLLTNLDIEVFCRGNDIVFDAVFDEQLQTKGGDHLGKAFRQDIDVDMQKCFKAGLQHIDVRSQELQLFCEGDRLSGVLAQQLPVEIGEFEDKGFGTVVLFADHDAEGAKGVEKEMRVDLLFKHFKARAEIFVLQLCIGQQNVFLFRQRGQGGLDRKDDKGSEGQFDEGQGKIGVQVDVKVVKELDEAYKGDDQDEIDEGLDEKADGRRPPVGGRDLRHGATARAFEAIGDPLVDGPKEKKEKEADDP